MVSFGLVLDDCAPPGKPAVRRFARSGALELVLILFGGRIPGASWPFFSLVELRAERRRDFARGVSGDDDRTSDC